MPCIYYTSEEITTQAQNDNTRLKRELDLATRLLCELTKKMEKDGVAYEIRGLKTWLKNHKRMDRARLASK